MNVFKKSFFEEPNLPANPKPFMVYFLQNGSYSEAYVTNREGQVKMLGNSQMIKDVVNSMNLGGEEIIPPTPFTIVVISEDEGFSVEANKGYVIGSEVMSHDVSIDVGGISNEGDLFELYNFDSEHAHTFRGDVYQSDGATRENPLQPSHVYQIRKVNGKLIIIN